MALQSLQKIKAVEEETEGLIRSARQQMARDVEAAKKKQEEAAIASEKQSRETLKKALKGVEEEAKILQEEQNKAVAGECQSLRETAEKRMPEAAQFIISRIFE